MKKWILALLLSMLAVAASAAPPVANQVAKFPTARAAQRHCPMDKILWLDTFTGRYYYAGSKKYGKTAQGGFVCKKELKGIGKTGK
jgi:hypothetical protein